MIRFSLLRRVVERWIHSNSRSMLLPQVASCTVGSQMVFEPAEKSSSINSRAMASAATELISSAEVAKQKLGGGLTASDNSDSKGPKSNDGSQELDVTELTEVDQRSPVDPYVGKTPADQLKIGSYHIVQELGRGGFGIVYLAEQRKPFRRLVALKVIRPDMGTSEVLARFEAERHALSLMDHPHIARVLDGGTTETGQAYFVMEFVDGIPITDYCDQQRLSISQRLQLFLSVCHAVQHAHQKGVIHRDLKPSNVIVRTTDGEPDAKVIDFGIAKAVSQSINDKNTITTPGQMIGSWFYMSPEQMGVTQDCIDTRSDVYSLGVLLYQLLTGTTPFEKHGLSKINLWDAMRVLREKEAPRPSDQLPTIDNDTAKIAGLRRTTAREISREIRGDLDCIVLKALEKDCDRRYESAGALAADIERYLNHQPIVAHPPRAAYLLRKFAVRNRLMLTAIVAVLIAVTIGSVVAVSQAIRANTERTRAELAKLDQVRQTHRAEELLYAAQMRIAAHLQQSGDDEQVELLLNRWIPSPDAADRRGLEWRLLNRNRLIPSQNLLDLRDDVSVVRISHDQSYVVTAANGGVIRRYDNHQSKEVSSWETRLTDVRRMEFSPSGQSLAVISYEGETVVLDATTGRIRYRLPPMDEEMGHSDVEFFDEYTLLTTGDDRLLYVWNVEDGRLRMKLDFDELMIVDSAVNSDSSQLLVLLKSRDRQNCELRSYDKPGGNQMQVLPLPRKAVATSLAVSHRGRFAAVGFQNGLLQVWDLQTGQPTELTVGEQLQELAFSADDQFVAGAERSGVVHVWRWRDGSDSNELPTHIHWLAHARPARSVVFALDQRQLITAGFDGRIRRWNWEQRPQRRVIKADPGSEIAWVESRNALAYLNQQSLCLVDRSTGRLLNELPLPPASIGRQLTAAPDRCQLAWRTQGGPILHWNACSESITPMVVPYTQNTDTNPTIQFIQDSSSLLVTTSRMSTAKSWNLQSYQPMANRDFSPIKPRLVVVKPDEPQMYFLANDSLSLVNLTTGGIDRHWQFDGRDSLCMALTPKGDLLAVGYKQLVIQLVSTSDARVQQKLVGHLGGTIQLEFTPDGKTLLALDNRGVLKFWQVNQGADAMTWPSPRQILAFKLSQDGNWLAIRYEDEIEIIEIPPLSQSKSPNFCSD